MTKGRVGVIYFGISYSSGDTGAVLKKNKVHTDYRLNIQNHRNTFIDYFKDYDIDFFLATNQSKLHCELERDFRPVSISYPNEGKNNLTSRNNKIKAGINSLVLHAKNNNLTYDYILITRFDIYFKDDWKNVNIDLNKFNIVSQLESPELICDNFYLFPFQYLEGFSKTLGLNKSIRAHSLKSKIEKIAPIHYIKNEHRSVGKLSFYKLNRHRHYQQKTKSSKDTCL